MNKKQIKRISFTSREVDDGDGFNKGDLVIMPKTRLIGIVTKVGGLNGSNIYLTVIWSRNKGFDAGDACVFNKHIEEIAMYNGNMQIKQKVF